MSIHMTVTEQNPLSMTVKTASPVSMKVNTGGTSDHRALAYRDAVDQHPMSAITGLPTALDEVDSDALSNFDIFEIMQGG